MNLRPLILLLAASLAAAAPATQRDAESARAAVIARFRAALTADVPALDKLLAEDLDYCNFRGTCQSKWEYIGEVQSGMLRYVSFAPNIDRVKLLSDSAVVTGRLSVEAVRSGEKNDVNLSFAAVLVWRDDRWQMTTWTSTLIEKPK
jgi:hypothetical protein